MQVEEQHLKRLFLKVKILFKMISLNTLDIHWSIQCPPFYSLPIYFPFKLFIVKEAIVSQSVTEPGTKYNPIVQVQFIKRTEHLGILLDQSVFSSTVSKHQTIPVDPLIIHRCLDQLFKTSGRFTAYGNELALLNFCWFFCPVPRPLSRSPCFFQIGFWLDA